MEENQGFATAINCMDGRVQEPVISFLKQRFHVAYVDMITEAGPNKILSELLDYDAVNAIRRRAEFSIDKHGSTQIAIVGHHDCAGNPVDKETHLSHIRSAVVNLRAWFHDIGIIGLWINEQWVVEEVT